MSTQPPRQGLFEVIDSFAIRRRHEFYLIGLLREGTVQENWFVRVPLNPTLALTVRITAIEEVILSRESTPYVLLIIQSPDEGMTDLMLDLNIGSELLEISTEGQD